MRMLGARNRGLMYFGLALCVVPALTAPVAFAQAPLGSLSERYESGGRGPATVSTGKGDVGGVSYGTYQLASKIGRADAFVRKYYPNEFKGLKGGTAKFTAVWRKLAKADPKGLHAREHQYIKETHYDVMTGRLSKSAKLDVNTRSRAVQNVVWSTAVQHGPASKIINTALAPLMRKKSIDKITDAEIIRAVYAERGRKDAKGGLVYFRGNSAAVQRSVAQRFINEQRDALAALTKEGGS